MKVTINGFIHANVSRTYVAEKFVFFSSEHMDNYGYIKVMPHSFEVDIPDDFNTTAARVSGLERQKKALREEFDLRVKQINDEISKLQCLEFTPAEAA